MRYALIVKPDAFGGHVSEIYALNANSVSNAALVVARMKRIPKGWRFSDTSW